jgi:hypothetical protein
MGKRRIWQAFAMYYSQKLDIHLIEFAGARQGVTQRLETVPECHAK